MVASARAACFARSLWRPCSFCCPIVARSNPALPRWASTSAASADGGPGAGLSSGSSSSSSGPSTSTAPQSTVASIPSSKKHSSTKTSSASPSILPATDHRTIGRSQSLFLTHDTSPGTPFLLPHGMRLSRSIERVIRDLYDIYGYDEVQSPQLYKTSLWKQSGHWDNYRDDMFSVQGYNDLHNHTQCCPSHDLSSSSQSLTKGAEEGKIKQQEPEESFGLKPMNCPGHALMFASQERSYRDLPIRFAEFSPLHRNEASGALTGLTRVRRFHQDDAHVFCRPDQVSSEISSMLRMLTSAYSDFGFDDFELVLSTRPEESFLGAIEEWDAAENGLVKALEESKRPWKINKGDGAFYGPKIDIRLVDSQGKKHQTATIQLDFQLPQRFNLSYAEPVSVASSDNEIATETEQITRTDSATSEGSSSGRGRPVMIHRAILGSLERFMAILIEQTAGWWPFWLSPRQAVVLPAKTNHPELLAYAEKVKTFLSLGQFPTTTTTNCTTNSSSSSGDARSPSAEEGSGVQRQARHLQRFFVDVDVNPQGEKLAKLVRKAQLQRYNYILVVGEAEMQNGTVNLRNRDLTNAPPKVREMAQKDQQYHLKAGQYTLEELRNAFETLDRLHVW